MKGLLVIVFLTLSSNVMAHDDTILEKLSWIRNECSNLMTNHYAWVLGEKSLNQMTDHESECVVLWEWIQPPSDMRYSSCKKSYWDVLYGSEDKHENFHERCDV